MIFKKDNLRLGLVLGLLGPILGLLLFIFTSFLAYVSGFPRLFYP